MTWWWLVILAAPLVEIVALIALSAIFDRYHRFPSCGELADHMKATWIPANDDGDR